MPRPQVKSLSLKVERNHCAPHVPPSRSTGSTIHQVNCHWNNRVHRYPFSVAACLGDLIKNELVQYIVSRRKGRLLENFGVNAEASYLPNTVVRALSVSWSSGIESSQAASTYLVNSSKI